MSTDIIRIQKRKVEVNGRSNTLKKMRNVYDTIKTWNLSTNKRVSVIRLIEKNDEVCVDFREFNKENPKGITVQLEQYEKLKTLLQSIDTTIACNDSCEWNLSDNCKVTVGKIENSNTVLVNIRAFYGGHFTTTGIALTVTQYDNLKHFIPEMDTIIQSDSKQSEYVQPDRESLVTVTPYTPYIISETKQMVLCRNIRDELFIDLYEMVNENQVKGIILNIEQYEKLKDVLNDVKNALENKQIGEWKISDKRSVKILPTFDRFFLIHIREYNNGHPTKTGIVFTPWQFSKAFYERMIELAVDLEMYQVKKMIVSKSEPLRLNLPTEVKSESLSDRLRDIKDKAGRDLLTTNLFNELNEMVFNNQFKHVQIEWTDRLKVNPFNYEVVADEYTSKVKIHISPKFVIDYDSLVRVLVHALCKAAVIAIDKIKTPRKSKEFNSSYQKWLTIAKLHYPNHNL